MLALQIILELIGSVIAVLVSFTVVKTIVVDWVRVYEQQKNKEKEKSKSKSTRLKK